MKLFKSIFAIAVAAVIISSCGSQTTKTYEGISQNQMDSASYALGIAMGQQLKYSGIDAVNLDKFKAGLGDCLMDKEFQIKEEELGQVINTFVMALSDAQTKAADEREEKFFAENKTKEGVQQTESGLQYQIIDPGNPEIVAGDQDTVEVNYKGVVVGNTKPFDDSYERGEPIKFPLNRVIPGWTEGMKLIGEGGKIKLWIPYKLGYGPQSPSPDLPAYSTLVFDCELIKVLPYVEKEEAKKK